MTENFAAGVLERLGFGYEQLKEIRPDIIYVSNCGFGQVGPYAAFKTWGPIVQAVSGLTFASGLPGQPPAGWGYSYMDHTGGYYMAMAILLALIHRKRTGEGQWVDLACTEAALTLHGPALLDWTVNGRPMPARGPAAFQPQRMAADGAARHLSLRRRGRLGGDRLPRRGRLAAAGRGRSSEPWTDDLALSSLEGRLANQDALDAHIAGWTSAQDKFDVQRLLRSAGVPCSAVQTPGERVDHDPDTEGLWPDRHAHGDGRGAGRRAAGAVVGDALGHGDAARPASASTTRRCSGGCSDSPHPRSPHLQRGGRDMTALTGFRVIELANERIAFAGKLLADMGADVILVEPPGGDPARGYPPFLDDVPGPERSLWWWHYNTSKRGVTLDLDAAGDRAKFEALVAERRHAAGVRAAWPARRAGARLRRPAQAAART